MKRRYKYPLAALATAFAVAASLPGLFLTETALQTMSETQKLVKEGHDKSAPALYQCYRENVIPYRAYAITLERYLANLSTLERHSDMAEEIILSLRADGLRNEAKALQSEIKCLDDRTADLLKNTRPVHPHPRVDTPNFKQKYDWI